VAVVQRPLPHEATTTTPGSSPPQLANPNRARGAPREREHPWKAAAKGARPTAPMGPPPAGSVREVSRAEPALALVANRHPLGSRDLLSRVPVELCVSGIGWVRAVCYVRVWGFSGGAAWCGDLAGSRVVA
jgi:hypothetical protein